MTLAALLAAVIWTAALTGCAENSGDNSSKENEPVSSQSDDSAVTPEGAVLGETDLMQCFLTSEGTNYLGMTLDEFNAAAGGGYTEENSVEYDLGYNYAKFYYGELDSIFCGRAKLPEKLPVYCMLTLKDDGRIKKFTYYIEQGETDHSSAEVSDSIARCLAASLPEDYNAEYDVIQLGKGSARFANTADGYVFTVEHNDLDGSGFPVLMSLESYKDKYGME